MRPVAAQKERGHRLAQRRPRRKSNGRPIEGLAVGGDSTLADATCHQHVAPGLNVPKGRVRPELVSNPRRAKRYATQRVAYLFGSLSKNYANAPASAIIEETGVFSWKTGEKMHGMSQSS